MAATQLEISSWFDRGVAQGSAYLIVACDTFDWDDYPIFMSCKEDALARKAKLLTGANMQKLMEIYDLNADKAEQLAEHRAMRL